MACDHLFCTSRGECPARTCPCDAGCCRGAWSWLGRGLLATHRAVGKWHRRAPTTYRRAWTHRSAFSCLEVSRALASIAFRTDDNPVICVGWQRAAQLPLQPPRAAAMRMRGAPTSVRLRAMPRRWALPGLHWLAVESASSRWCRRQVCWQSAQCRRASP